MKTLTKLALVPLSSVLCFFQTNGLEESINSLLSKKNFQGSVLIAKGEKILFSKGYGLANIEHGISNTPETVFRIASITKQFTAVAILQLHDQGKLNINDPLSKYFPNYLQGDKITIHHLLTHTSGIPSITEFANLSKIQRLPSTPNQVMAYFKNMKLEFTPGTDCKYSDSGYIVLGALIEEVTQNCYANYVQKHFFIPLGMQNTYFDENQKLIPHRASGYRLNSKGELLHAEFIEMSFPHAAGSLASNVKDLYLWDRALIQGKLLSKTMQKEFLRVQASSKKNKIAYGMGSFIDQKKHTIGHRGSIEGFRAAYYHHLNEDVTVIILSNQEATNAVELEKDLFSLVSTSWR